MSQGKIRILYVNANNDEIGGSDIALLRLVIEAKRNGIYPIVLLRKLTPIVTKYEENGVRVIVKPIVRLRNSVSWLEKIKYFLSDIPRSVIIIRKVIQNEDVDLVHANDIIDGLANISAMINQVPVVQHIRVIVNKKTLLSLFLKTISLFTANWIICISNAVKDNMFPKPNKKVSVIYDWIERDLETISTQNKSIYKELRIDPNNYLVGCIGRLEWWKGQHVFLGAIELVAKQISNVHFLIVGGATPNKEDYEKELILLIDSSKYSSRIHLLGFRDDIFDIMRHLTVLVHSSILPEPFGLVIMEGMYCGSIVVAAKAGGVLEQIDDEFSGFLYLPGDANDMARKITLAISDKNRIKIVENARNTVKFKFNSETNSAKILDIYNQLLIS